MLNQLGKYFSHRPGKYFFLCVRKYRRYLGDSSPVVVCACPPLPLLASCFLLLPSLLALLLFSYFFTHSFLLLLLTFFITFITLTYFASLLTSHSLYLINALYWEFLFFRYKYMSKTKKSILSVVEKVWISLTSISSFLFPNNEISSNSLPT